MPERSSGNSWSDGACKLLSLVKSSSPGSGGRSGCLVLGVAVYDIVLLFRMYTVVFRFRCINESA